MSNWNTGGQDAGSSAAGRASGLSSWEGTGSKAPTPAKAVAEKKAGRRRLRKVLLWGGGAVVLLLVAGLALAPTIASSMAPGMIEGAVNPGIKGRVKVAKASIGWFKGLEAGPIEVYDPAGAMAAQVTASAPVTVWKALSGRYWAATRLDLGTIDVNGNLELKQYLDGTTNLQRAFAPKEGAAPSPGKPPAESSPSKPSGKPLPAINATLRVTQFGVSVRNEQDNFKTEIGLKQLKGEAKVDADLGAPGGGVVKAAADFSGSAVTPSGGGAAATALKLDADIKQVGGGKGGWTPDGIEKARIKLALNNAPIGVADALASMGGALVQGVGDTADLNLDVDGNAKQLDAKVKMTSAGLNADASLAMRDGVLTSAADKPSTVSLKSAEFLQNLPQTRAGVSKAAEKVKLTSAPSVEVVLESLRVPLPQGGVSSNVSTLDFRGASVGLRVKVSGMSGQVLLPKSNTIIAEASSGPPQGTWTPFTVEPVVLTVNIPDLSKPVSISTGTKATLDGKPAGDIQIAIDADGLLDAQGHVRALQKGQAAGFASKADARVKFAGISTALAQPLVAEILAPLPVDLAQDVGPTLDVNLLAKADVAAVKDAGAVGAGLDTLPPMDITGDIASRNIRANIASKLDKGMLTAPGEGIKLTVDAAAPLAQRIVRASREAQLKDPKRDPKAAPPPEITLTGAGKVELAVNDLAISLKDTSPETILASGKGAVSLALSDLNAAVNMGGTGGNKSPVRIDRHAVTATLTPGSGPRIVVDGKLSHDNQPFTIEGDYTLAGLSKGLPKSKGPGVLAEMNPTGKVVIKSLPRSVLAIVPATAGYASEAGVAADADAMARAIAAMVRESIGANTTLTVNMLPAAPDIGGGQLAELTVATAASGVGTNVWVRIAEKEAELRLLNSFVQLTPANTNPVLGAAMAPKPGEPAQPGGGPRLGAPVRLSLLVDKPVKVPLLAGADGSVTPDWSGAGVLNAKLTSDTDLTVDNIAMGGGGKDAQGNVEPVRTASLSLRGVAAEVIAPLAGVPETERGKQRATVKLGATALNHGTGDAQIAKLAVDATALMNGKSPDATVKLSEVSSLALENLLGQKDLIVGAIGETAEATLRVKPGAGGAGTIGEVLGLEAEMTSPRVTGMKLALAKDDAHLWLTQPSAITWKPNEAFINKYVLGGDEEAGAAAPGQPGDQQQGRKRRRQQDQAGAAGSGAPQPAAVSLEQAQPIAVNIAKLAVAMGAKDASGNDTAGPLKPGVFELDLSARAPSMSMNVAASKAGQPPTKLTIEGLTINASSAKAPAGAATPGPLELDLVVDRVSGAGANAGKKSTAHVQLSNLADGRGVVTSDKAVVNADVDIAAFPTPIVDNLASQGGLMTELLGPTVTLVAKARNVSKGAGTGAATAAGDLNVEATSQRATAKIKGDVKNGRFVQTGPVSVEVREIRNELVRVLAGSIPVIETLEKSPPDEPATVKAEGLMVPLDNNLKSLNGKIAVDVGVARFTTNSLLGDLIKGLGGRESGTVGKKIEPFVVNIKDGVATYDRFRLPVGEFFLETRGTVDLVQRKIDIVTYAPIGALTDKAIGKLGAGLTGKLNEVLQVPFTTKGSMDNPDRLYPDAGLFVKEAGENLLKDPGKIIDNVIGDLIKPKPKK